MRGKILGRRGRADYTLDGAAGVAGGDVIMYIRTQDSRQIVDSGYIKDALASLRRSGFQLYNNGKLIKGGGL